MAGRLESKAFLKQVRPIWSLLPLGMTLFFCVFGVIFLANSQSVKRLKKTSKFKKGDSQPIVLIEFTLRRWSLKGHTGECYFTRGEESNENQLVWYRWLRCHTQASSWRPAVTAGVVGWWTSRRGWRPRICCWRSFFVGGWRTLDWTKTSHLML